MAKNPTWIAVVAMARERRDGRWLMYRRPPDKRHGGLWEFPGGKVEPGETPRAALVREVNEELGLILDAAEPRPAFFADAADERGGGPIVILLYSVPFAQGVPQALEGGEVGWFSPAEIAALAKPPLDVELARRLFAGRA